jgi:hypothetical protein
MGRAADILLCGIKEHATRIVLSDLKKSPPDPRPMI